LSDARKAESCRFGFAYKVEGGTWLSIGGRAGYRFAQSRRAHALLPEKAADLIRGLRPLDPLGVPVYIAPEWERANVELTSVPLRVAYRWPYPD
jgi:hypothetical protein